MLKHFFPDPTALGAAQAVLAALVSIGVMLLARGQAIHIERETIIALVRGLVQIVVVGVVLVALLQMPAWVSLLLLLGMVLAATETAARRAAHIPGAFWISLAGIALGSGVLILVMTALGVIEFSMTSLVPVGSMIIANAMNSNALALERFRAEVESHTGQIEAGLALGADPQRIVLPYTRAAITASLIPRIDTLRSLGIVWIPGLMAGMVLSGSSPIYAAVYQFVVIALIFAAAGLTSLISTLLIRSRAFSPAEQLVLRPGAEERGATA